MATGSQISSAAMTARPPVGSEYMHRDAILALPVQERDEAVRELVRARRCVIRLAGEHAEEILPMLGLVDVGEETKLCADCGHRKPVEQFHRKSAVRSRSVRCNACQQARKSAKTGVI